MTKTLLVVIDGPAGAGKSTVAKALAARIGASYLDTGAMYRALTLRCLRRGVPMDDPAAVIACVEGARLEMVPEATGVGLRVVLDGDDVGGAIRTREVTNAIYRLANDGAVRERVVAQQRRIAAGIPRSLVAEGRDLGSVVFPAADVRVYLDASVEERARRRAQDLVDPPPLDELQAEIARRDARDRERAVGPLVRTPAHRYLDTSDLSPEQVIERLAALVAEAA